ncbi:AMP-dependent synthetase/ligase [Marseilla massiliensis]|jgi:long-chain acyl-CoA synthetase|uniref:Long-chain fatty acid--CoA ligase n=1 Tax=Marseilla massiliensis TaxID=1841864 RepID=A0A938WVH4_9BACT|nr:long-chain fatty acid--CoA ligase [Marseilla massiliensis]MBM6674909.1 long-chain fatty acid--CoA ligase [Marseilla massiliensis]
MQTKCHLSVLIHRQAEKYGNRRALIYRDFGGTKWKSATWRDFSRKVRHVSNALLNIGVRVQENVGVFSQNAVEYLYTDFGAFGIRAVTVPFYATSSEQQIQYMIDDAQIRVLFVGEQEQYDKARRVFVHCHTLERIIIYDRRVEINPADKNSLYFDDFMTLGENSPRQSEVEKLYAEACDDDLCNILYTSGTTGNSKGVMLTYGQYHAALEANDKVIPVGESDRIMDFLPMTHIFERAWLFLCISEGAEIVVNTNPKDIQQSMRQVHPTCMCAVPRFWEKVYAEVIDRIDRTTPAQRKLLNKALEIGRRHNIEYLSKGRRPPLALRMKYALMHRTLFRIVRDELGLDRPNIFPTAGATVSAEIESFVHSIGICMIVGYGLTESLATVSADFKGRPFTVGSVGRLIDGLQVKFGENDEIMLKGPTITKGYYKREELNKLAFDEEGFFHTGDSGYLKNGELFLTDRIKDLFKTSNGKYIAPQIIESKLLVDKFIDQIAVIADRRKFVSALIIPDYALLEEYAVKHGIKFNSREELCADAGIHEMMAERIETLQQQLASYEKIKRFTLLPNHFTMERGELTNTLKIRRKVLNKNYAAEIEKMYEEEVESQP